MKNKEWAILIGVVIVIALVVSLVTVNLTGNVIKQNNNLYGRYKVYTTGEVDAKLNNVATNQGVLDMLNNKCDPNGFRKIGSGDIGSEALDTCTEICKSEGKQCINGFIGKEDLTTETHSIISAISCSKNIGGTEAIGFEVQCVCCSP